MEDGVRWEFRRYEIAWCRRRVLSLIWEWLEAGVMEDGRETKLLSGTRKAA
jgi:hypothetical protein